MENADRFKKNKVIQPMGPLQPGLPQPIMIPVDWNTKIIDLKDCFFTIPLQPSDCEIFAFTIPSPNNYKPTAQYQWKVLPQGILNSPTLCQYFVNRPLEKLRRKFPDSLVIHYKDILIAHKNLPTLQTLYE